MGKGEGLASNLFGILKKDVLFSVMAMNILKRCPRTEKSTRRSHIGKNPKHYLYIKAGSGGGNAFLYRQKRMTRWARPGTDHKIRWKIRWKISSKKAIFPVGSHGGPIRGQGIDKILN